MAIQTPEQAIVPPITEESLETHSLQATMRAIQALAVVVGSEVYYEAADPGYKSSFSRDSLTAMSLLGDEQKLLSQIDYSARRQGRVMDPTTGEEPGKIHHELPSYKENGRSTDYNACDTTALFLQSIAALAERGHDGILHRYQMEIHKGASYIISHINSRGLFAEDPAMAGLSHTDPERSFALKVTYWKDSELNRPGDRTPHYPIVYSLAHFQNAHALERIGRATGKQQLIDYGERMYDAGLRYLWREDHFVTAIDEAGDIDGLSSDSLHNLLYIPPEKIPKEYVHRIEKYMKQLETLAGYRAGIALDAGLDPYHTQVWTHEQALLHAAAALHDLKGSQEVARGVLPFIIPEEHVFPEYLDPESFQPDGNILQLWTMGAYAYFINPERAIL